MRKHSLLVAIVFLGGLAALAVTLVRRNPSLVVGNQSAISRGVFVQTVANTAPVRSLANYRASYSDLPLTFEANRGQVDSSVKFLARGNRYAVFLTPQEFVLSYPKLGGRKTGDGESTGFATGALRMTLLGANPAPSVIGDKELPARSNYFLGNDPSQWRAAIPTYASVKYEQVYPGVDLVFHGNQGQLEYDFVLGAGAHPDDIQFRLDGADKMSVGNDGSLLLQTGDERMQLHKPLVYQDKGGQRQYVASNYVIKSDGTVGFALAAFDAGSPVVIDPTLSVSTYLGGSLEDDGFSLAFDSAGNVVLTGRSFSPNFPTKNAPQPHGPGENILVVKLNAALNQIMFSTLIGGAASGAGTVSNGGHTVALDPSDNIYLTGATNASNFPTTAGAFQPGTSGTGSDAFLIKLKPDGTALLYSSYLGGSGAEKGFGLAVDPSGMAYIMGYTNSVDFPTTAGAFQIAPRGGFDAFVTKINPAGKGRSDLVFSTYLGGSADEAGLDFLNPGPGVPFTGGPSKQGLAIDSSGNVYIAGRTMSTDFPTKNAIQASNGGAGKSDGFVTELNAAGTALIYSTYLGGASDDYANGIVVDSSGNAYVTGYSNSSNFPTTPGAFQRTLRGSAGNAFITKIKAGGSALLYSTYLGGSAPIGNGDNALSIAIDAAGNAYVTGEADSPIDFPTLNAIQTRSSGMGDVFITEMNPAGSALVFSTYLGGASVDQGVWIKVDGSGNIYATGFTSSTNFPTANPFQASNAGSNDVFLVKITGLPVSGPAPSVADGGTVNNASFSPGTTPLAPGTIAAIFGTNLNDGSSNPSSAFDANGKLLTTLGGASVSFNGIAAPLFSSFASQLNVQIPMELSGASSASVQVTVAGQTSAPRTVPLGSASPGIFTVNNQGTGQGIVQIANTTIFAAPASSIDGVQTQPANRGDFITIYCTGLGGVSNAPATGFAASGDLLSATIATPQVSIGGIPASVSFSGLAPGFVGLYQINAQVPAASSTGDAIPIVFSIGGVSSNTVTIAVQ